jgi:ParB/RepB/Spo0J family partition protein
MEFRKEALDELAGSVEQTGVLEPILVRPLADGYEVVVGERRYRAAQQAHLSKVPAIVHDYTDEEVVQLNLVENIQREDLSGVEKGRAVKNLLDRFPKMYPSVNAVAKVLSYSESTIKGWLELGRAPDEVQALVAPIEKIGIPRKKGTIDSDTALTITRKIAEPKRQVALAKALAKAPVYRRSARRIVQEVSLHPDKSIEDIVNKVTQAPASIPFMPEHVPPIRKGIKTQTSRKGIDPRIRVGARIEAYTKFAELSVTDISRKKLGDFTEEDAKREGGYTLEEFKEVWKKLHGEWNPNETVNVVRFKVDKITI